MDPLYLIIVIIIIIIIVYVIDSKKIRKKRIDRVEVRNDRNDRVEVRNDRVEVSDDEVRDLRNELKLNFLERPMLSTNKYDYITEYMYKDYYESDDDERIEAQDYNEILDTNREFINKESLSGPINTKVNKDDVLLDFNKKFYDL